METLVRLEVLPWKTFAWILSFKEWTCKYTHKVLWRWSVCNVDWMQILIEQWKVAVIFFSDLTGDLKTVRGDLMVFLFLFRDITMVYFQNRYILYVYTRGIHKRMVRFQKLTRNLLVTLHGHNLHLQQRQLSKFLIRYQQFTSHAYCGASFQDGFAAGKGFLCAPFWGVQCTV